MSHKLLRRASRIINEGARHDKTSGEASQTRTRKVPEDGWAVLRAVARKWRQIDKDLQDERDEELEVELKALQREDHDGEEGENDKAEGGEAALELEAEAHMQQARDPTGVPGIPIPHSTTPGRSGGPSAAAQPSRNSSLATPPSTGRSSLRPRPPKGTSYPELNNAEDISKPDVEVDRMCVDHPY